MNKIEKFKLFIRFIVSIFASREFAFVYCIVGTLSQTAHTYYLIESISSLEGWAKIFQAVGLSIFISSSLLFFTAIADNDEESRDYHRIHLAVNLFMCIEIIINAYYYAAHLLIHVENPNIFDFIFAILVSCLIPVTIKLYAGIIQAKEWLESLENKYKSDKKEYIKPEDFEKLQNKLNEVTRQNIKLNIKLKEKENQKIFDTTNIDTYREMNKHVDNEQQVEPVTPEDVDIKPISNQREPAKINSVTIGERKYDVVNGFVVKKTQPNVIDVSTLDTENYGKPEKEYQPLDF